MAERGWWKSSDDDIADVAEAFEAEHTEGEPVRYLEDGGTSER